MPSPPLDAPGRPGRRLRIRVLLDTGEPFGPGKADLLEAIRDTGSIAAAGRRMGMSYQRAWELVAVMNRHFREPIVAPAKGGQRGGGTTLTPLGTEVLAVYREIERRAEQAAAAQLDWLRRQLASGDACEGASPPRAPPPRGSGPLEPRS